jgi:hypothetical protein
MRYKTKIVPQNGGYIGYAFLNEDVVYTTKNHKDTVMVVRELTSYIATISQPSVNQLPTQRVINSTAPALDNLVPVNKNVNIPVPGPIPIPAPASSTPVSAPRRCCGRG